MLANECSTAILAELTHLGQELRELAARKALEMQGPDRLITLPLTGCDTFPVDRGHGARARYSRTG